MIKENYIHAIFFCLFCTILCSCGRQPNKVLIFSETVEFRHGSIESGVVALEQLLAENNIQSLSTEDAAYFTEDSLKQFQTVIFLNTTGDVLDHLQQADFERYIQAGGGYVGIHAATDTEYDWPWYNKLAGAYFNGHPDMQNASLNILNVEDPACHHLPNPWNMHEEWYNFKSIYDSIEVLVSIDESSYDGGTNGADHPIVWKHEYDGGRGFYTAIGHKEETFSDTAFLQQLWAGIEYSMGDGQLNYSMAHTERIPEENRFSKRVLDFNLAEPMELDELPGRGILYIERRGAVKLFDYASNQTQVLDSIPVYYDDEDGLLGFAVDPNFEENNWVYFFYSPNIIDSIQRVSRFTLLDDQFQEEKVLLTIPLIRECCHSGGSLEFGPDGLLYVGVGDNTNPFKSSGYAPIDERPGRELYDAQRSAGNTNDLRGKILRIKPMDEGSYVIPEGNLFPEGMANTRPEIFVMGVRNPFRFSIHGQSGDLYWGDVGPDAGSADSLRGPSGMGEFNHAKSAGFYGWPYSRGNNSMYVDYNFRTRKSTKQFEPDQILNQSPNNTGLEKLPPIQSSMIWYSYGSSNNFPWLKAGGINPMSGPIYDPSLVEKNEHSLPSYFKDKWFIYEWMRNWIYVVHLDDEGRYIQADPFMKGTEFSRPMDMLITKSGALYMLEYGQKWNSRNLDARLIAIDYNPGNRPPRALYTTDKEVGAAPMTIQFDASTSVDYDRDDIRYNWSFGTEEIQTETPNISYTFQKPGIYDVALIVTDETGQSGSVNKKFIVGNEAPEISVDFSDPNVKYWNNRKVQYKVEVFDLEDGSTNDQSLDLEKVKVTFNYIPEGEDMILASIGHQQNVTPRGLSLIRKANCTSCHAIEEKVAGPSYTDIAKRYDVSDKQTMIRRIIKGSQGVWGEAMMAPHPHLSISEVDEIVSYILSLNPDKQINEKHIPLEGELTFKEHVGEERLGKYVFMVSYLDEGHPDIASSQIAVSEIIVFGSLKIQLENAVDLDKELGTWESQGRSLVGSIKHGKHLKFAPISFDDLSSIRLGAAFVADYPYGGDVEFRAGKIDGPLLGKKRVEYFDENKEGFKVYDISITPMEGIDSLFMVFKNPVNEDQYTMNGDWIELNYDRE